MTRLSLRKLREVLPPEEIERLGLTAEPKYHNERVEIDGIRFDSKREAARYVELRLLESAGMIRYIEVHPRFRLEINGVHICDYIADFSYHDPSRPLCSGTLIVEDVKGVRTAAYRLKARLMLAIHGVEVREV